MDKYEYNIKADQIMKLIDRRDFKTAAKIADGIDWRRVRNINMLTNVGCVYQAVKRYTDAKEIFQLARNRAPLGRRLVYQMADVCIDAGEFEEAEHYIQEFSELAPKDTARFELLYQLSKRKGEPIENQIAILEEYKKQDFDERWSFELAKLYHKAGYNQKCVAACDELVLWFGEGQYVDKAMELKMLHAPLSPSQQEKYRNIKKKQETPVIEEEVHSNSRPKGKNQDNMYNTENLQAALTKSIQEIMEAEERQKASYPSGRSYFEEYQSEQEERDAMFAATRDLRKEREKFKNMMTQPIPSLITEGNFSEDSLMQNTTQPHTNYKESFEQAEEETRRVFEAAKGTFEDTKEIPPTFEMLEEEEENVYELSEAVEESMAEAPAFYDLETEDHLEPLQKEMELFPLSGEKEKGNFNNAWEETETIFERLKKEQILQEETEEIKNEIQEELEEATAWKELEETEKFEEKDIPEQIEEDSQKEESADFPEEDFWGQDFYYQVPEEKEPEYIEVPFSLSQLNTNEIPTEIYYRILDYDPQPFLDKAAVSQAETDLNTKWNKLDDIDEAEEMEPEDDSKELEEIDSEADTEQMMGVTELEIEQEYEEEEAEYEEFPEGGTEEEFYDYIMLRSYGVDEMSEDAYYQVEGYQEEEAEETIDPVASKEEESDDYVYGFEMMPEDAYYEVPGYDPENFLVGRTENRGLEEEILGQKPQVRIQNKPAEKGTSKQKTNGKSKNKSEKSSSVRLEAMPEDEMEKKLDTKSKLEQQMKNEEPPLELAPELKNVFANYLHLPGVEQQIAEILSETERIGEEQETSMSGNILLMGEVKSGKTTLAVALIKAINRLNGRKGRKVAKISGDRLNNKGIKESISRLAGADLIIEHAGEMRISTVTELLEAMGDYTGGMIVVLEDTRTSIQRLVADVPQIAVCFTHSIELKECNIAEWAEAAKSYAQENHYMVDDMAMLALSAKIDAVYASKKNIMIEDVQDIIDDAIEKAERRNKKLFGRLFSKKKDSDSILLRESDFS